MLSVLNGHTDCVYSLLNKGANVDAKDKWGRTALHRGVRNSLYVAPFPAFFASKYNIVPYKKKQTKTLGWV